MDNSTFLVSDLFNPKCRPEKAYPFNLSFGLKTFQNRKCFNGPGIYVIAYDEVVIYVGQFASYGHGDVRSDRIKMHLEGMTLRGAQCGFRPESADLIRFNIQLMSCLKDYPLLDLKFKKKTGVDVSPYKVSFALEHINDFLDADIESFLSRFRIAYLQLSSFESIDLIEKKYILDFNPCCNNEYDPSGTKIAFENAIRILRDDPTFLH